MQHTNTKFRFDYFVIRGFQFLTKPVVASVWLGFSFLFFQDVILGLLFRNYDYLSSTFFVFDEFLLASFSAVFILRYIEKKKIGRNWYKDKLPSLFLFKFLFSFFVITTTFHFFVVGTEIFINERYLPANTFIIRMVMIVFYSIFYALFSVFYQLFFIWRNSLIQIEKMKKENSIARFESLKSQVNPHFLFNSLNTLVALIQENPTLSVEYVRQLALLYRYVLEVKDKDSVTLAEEKIFLNAYSQLIQIRFGEKVLLKIDLPDVFDLYLMAPLSLQLLLENCLKHNFATRNKPLEIKIYVHVNYTSASQRVFLVVENNKQLKPDPDESTRIGLENLEKRYFFLFDSHIEVIDHEGFFKVVLPLIEKG
jgi:sensor histidine kinase YesM